MSAPRSPLYALVDRWRAEAEAIHPHGERAGQRVALLAAADDLARELDDDGQPPKPCPV